MIPRCPRCLYRGAILRDGECINCGYDTTIDAAEVAEEIRLDRERAERRGRKELHMKKKVRA